MPVPPGVGIGVVLVAVEPHISSPGNAGGISQRLINIYIYIILNEILNILIYILYSYDIFFFLVKYRAGPNALYPRVWSRKSPHVRPVTAGKTSHDQQIISNHPLAGVSCPKRKRNVKDQFSYLKERQFTVL